MVTLGRCGSRRFKSVLGLAALVAVVGGRPILADEGSWQITTRFEESKVVQPKPSPSRSDRTASRQVNRSVSTSPIYSERLFPASYIGAVSDRGSASASHPSGSQFPELDARLKARISQTTDMQPNAGGDRKPKSTPNLNGAKHPVVLVPPFTTGKDYFLGDSLVFDSLTSDLISAGWKAAELFEVSLSTYGSNADKARELKREVDRVRRITGADKVDIVAYSAGALVARYYVQVLGGEAVVSELISIAGTNHGTALFHAGVASPLPAFNPIFNKSARELRTGSSFLQDLNARPLPRGVRVFSIYSHFDDVNIPASTQKIAGAINVAVPVLGVGVHVRFASEPVVHEMVRLALENRVDEMNARGNIEQ